ncbi:unnamed protein product [Phaedon cochleariae]|uniref:UDP-glucuronosyltransferase n=1 Tax=Phaedon cochleariae TaxID=80249 RepID=A0A9P0DNK0_PHACE|nr:unnamed protein product [Phaedon cochleariae]
MQVLLIIFLGSSLSLGTDSARILGVFQIPAVSHQCVFQPIWKELSLRGHEVVVVTPNPLRNASLVNLTEIEVSETRQIFERHGFQFFMNKENYVHTKIAKLFALNYDLAEAIFNNRDFLRIYNDTNAEFDLIITQSYISPIFYSLAARFQAPLIGVASMGGYIGTDFAMGNPHPPSLYSEMFLPYHGQMSMYERIKSTLFYLWAKYYLTFHAMPKSDAIARKYLGNDLPYIEDIERNMSLLFLTTNPILYSPRPTVPTIISLEQMHIKPVGVLPQDLQNFLDKAKEGVIYFSLGSNVKSVNIPEHVRNTLIEAFAELPYQVLWKFEADSLPNQPKNVMIRKLLPQQDVLAHPNVKVFLTQCGLQSIEEAVSRGVPMVGIPFIADQTMNIKRLQGFEVALGIDYLTMTKEEVKEKIIEVAENPKYRNNMKKLASLWVDQPMKSLDRAIWWIEYVLRHKGTKHLRSPTVDVSWIEYFMLDVIFIAIVIRLCIVYLEVKIFKYLWKLIFCWRKEKIN